MGHRQVRLVVEGKDGLLEVAHWPCCWRVVALAWQTACQAEVEAAWLDLAVDERPAAASAAAEVVAAAVAVERRLAAGHLVEVLGVGEPAGPGKDLVAADSW